MKMKLMTKKMTTGLLLLSLLLGLSACHKMTEDPAKAAAGGDFKATEAKREDPKANKENESLGEVGGKEAKEKEDKEKEAKKNGNEVNPDDEIVLAAYRNTAPGAEDAYYCSVILYVWEPLITMDEKGEPMGKLAKSWEMSPDAKTYTFHLEEGVKFHDGEPFNADAVLYNFDRMKSGQRQSGFYNMSIDRFYPNLDQVKKLDDHTVQLTFREPSPTLPYTMTNFGSAMFSPKSFNENYDFKGIAAGTGPYKIMENVKDQYVLLERNEDYWGDKAVAKTIRIKTIPDVNTRFSAMKSGEIMGVIDIRAFTPALAVELAKDPQFAIETTKSTMIDYLCLNGVKPPFDDIRMRRAVSLLIDRDTIANQIYLGYVSPTANLLNYSTPFYKEFPVEHDVNEAKRLAGEVLGGSRVSVTYLILQNNAEQKTEAEFIASLLQQIGVDVTIESYDYAAMWDKQGKGDYGIARHSKGLNNMDGLTMFKQYMDSAGELNVKYSLGSKDQEIDSLIKQADVEIDIERRRQMYNELQELSVERQPIVPIFNEETLLVYNKKLSGYQAKIYGIELPKIGWAR